MGSSNSNRGLSKKPKIKVCSKNYSPVPIKTTPSNDLNILLLTNIKKDAPSNVTKNNMEVSFDADNFAASQQNIEEDDTSSVEAQKVTAVVAVIDTSTEDPDFGIEHSKRCRRTKKLLFTKKIRVLLDSGSDGDIWFHRKGATKRFPYTERQVVKSYHTSAGVFRTKGQAKFEMKFFEYSNPNTILLDLIF